MAYTGYECLDIHVDRGVATVTIDHPPINLFDLTLIQEMDRVGRELEADGDVRVAVFQSANPDFFIAHADVALIRTLPVTVPPKATRLGLFHAMVDRFRTMPKATVAAAERPTVVVLLEEAHCFNQSLATSLAQERMQRFLALGGQTREVELDLGGPVEKLRD